MDLASRTKPAWRLAMISIQNVITTFFLLRADLVGQGIACVIRHEYDFKVSTSKRSLRKRQSQGTADRKDRMQFSSPSTARKSQITNHSRKYKNHNKKHL